MRDYLIKSTTDIHRMRCKQHKFLGHWFYKQMTAEEWERNEKFFITRNDDIKTQDQFVEMMLKLQQVR